MEMRGQVSVEYMILIGFVMIVLSALLLISLVYTTDFDDSVTLSQVDRIVAEMADAVDTVYYQGEPSRTTLKIFFPEGIEGVQLNQTDINFKVRTRSGVTDVFRKTSVPMQGIIDTGYGYHNMLIEARQGYVWINAT